MESILFAPDGEENLHELKKFIKYADDLRALGKLVGQVIPCIGCYKGKLENSFLCLAVDYDKYFKDWTKKQVNHTLYVFRTSFVYGSNFLDFVSQRLGFRPKVNIKISHWLKIVKTGDKKTLKKVLDYNVGDVKEGKKVLEKLMKYSGNKDYYGSIT